LNNKTTFSLKELKRLSLLSEKMVLYQT